MTLAARPHIDTPKSRTIYTTIVAGLTLLSDDDHGPLIWLLQGKEPNRSIVVISALRRSVEADRAKDLDTLKKEKEPFWTGTCIHFERISACRRW